MAQCELHSAHEEMLQTIKGQIVELFGRLNDVERLSTELKVQSTMTLQAVNRIEAKLESMAKEQLPQLIPAKESFWNSKTGQTFPWIIGIIVVVTIVALTGQNIAQTLASAKELIPK